MTKNLNNALRLIVRYADEIEPGDWDTCFVTMMARFAWEEVEGEELPYRFRPSRIAVDVDKRDYNFRMVDLVRNFWGYTPEQFDDIEKAFEYDFYAQYAPWKTGIKSPVEISICSAIVRICEFENIDATYVYPAIRPVLKQVKKARKRAPEYAFDWNKLVNGIRQFCDQTSKALEETSEAVKAASIQWKETSAEGYAALRKIWSMPVEEYQQLQNGTFLYLTASEKDE